MVYARFLVTFLEGGGEQSAHMSADVQLPCMLETYGDGDHNGYKMSHMQILIMCRDGDPNMWNMQTSGGFSAVDRIKVKNDCR